MAPQTKPGKFCDPNDHFPVCPGKHSNIETFKDPSTAFLSNFYCTNVGLDGIIYPTAEHAYTAAKTQNRDVKLEIAALVSPVAAKKFGRHLDLRCDWKEVRDREMYRLVLVKFLSNSDLIASLLATGSQWLTEGNNWGDVYWGRSLMNGHGRNTLGMILMEVRRILKEMKTCGKT